MIGTLVDVFNNDAFSFTSLTAEVNRMPFVPFQAGKLGIFKEEGVPTTTMAVEMIDGQLSLIPNTKRGAPAQTNEKLQRKVVNFSMTHLPTEDTIQASEIQNVRDLGSTSLMKGPQALVHRRAQQMLSKHDATVEYQRVKALQGILLDSDGSTVLYNLYTVFQKQQSSVDFLFGTSTTDIHGKCQNVLDQMETNVGSFTYDKVWVYCGKTWFESFIGHPKVQAAYQYFTNHPDREPMREDVRYGGFNFGGLTFEKYRGTVNGIPYVADNEAYAFPIGGTSEDMYQTVFAPGDFMECVNTIGLPRYMKVYVDIEFQRFVKLHIQSNPLSIMNRPEASIKLITSN